LLLRVLEPVTTAGILARPALNEFTEFESIFRKHRRASPKYLPEKNNNLVKHCYECNFFRSFLSRAVLHQLWASHRKQYNKNITRGSDKIIGHAIKLIHFAI